MEIKYQIFYLEDVVGQHIPHIPPSAQLLIKRAIDERLAIDPLGFGRPMRYSLKGYRRLRVSDFRIIYRIDPDEKVIVIVAIKNRKDVYAYER
jgi:mRNA-degrading endonuclease RelE of RelBE toxin-antitoxin system